MTRSFAWLESTAVSIWIVESPSLFAFPGILAAHTVGLGLLAGLNGALDLRLLGIARSIPPRAFTRVVPVMCFGLWVNVLSGIALVIAYPTKALTNPLFYLKLGLIAAALAILRSILRRAGPGDAVPATTKMLAAASLLTWAAASGKSQWRRFARAVDNGDRLRLHDHVLSARSVSRRRALRPPGGLHCPVMSARRV